MLNDSQLDILIAIEEGTLHTRPARIEEIAQDAQASHLSDEELLEFLNICNVLYRGGEPLISDRLYDSVFLAELQKRHPGHPFLTSVEPEQAFAGKTVTLPQRMLSTEKAYTMAGIEKWLKIVEKAAAALNINPGGLIYRATPKLDGFAAYDDGKNTLHPR